MDGTMPRTEKLLAPRLKFRDLGGRDGERGEPCPEIVHRLFGRVDHIRSVETVVTQLIKHDFVGREIFTTLRELGDDLVQGEQECAFAELVAVSSVLEVADRGDGEDEFLLRMPGDHIHKQRRCLADGKPPAGEFLGVDFQTVRDDLARAGIFIDPGCAEGYDDFRRGLPTARGFLKASVGDIQELIVGAAGEGGVVAERADEIRSRAHRDALVFSERDSRSQPGDGIADGDGVVDCSERVDADIKSQINHLPADVVSEAAPEDENPVFQRDADSATAGFHRSL